MASAKLKLAAKILASIVACVLCGAIIFYLRAPSLNIAMVDELAQITPGDRVLIVAPHCDDETLGAGGLIQDALARGAAVRVVIVTNGDNNLVATDLEFKTIKSSAREFVIEGERRQQESLNALAILGVPARDVLFLGYPDQGLKHLYLTNWSADNPYRSRATRDTKAPYRLIYEPGVAYAGENLLGNLAQILAEYRPTIVIGPHLDDHHPDHHYTAEFVLRALSQPPVATAAEPPPRLYNYLVHFPHFPRPKGLRFDDNLLPPWSAFLDMRWYKLSLPPAAERRKQDAIAMYTSQIRTPELGTLMRGFVRRNELFEQVDYQAPQQ
jgi:LmbE family N-acetylglucosaminyl deacetylase